MPEVMKPTRIERKVSARSALIPWYSRIACTLDPGQKLDWIAPEKLHVTLIRSCTPGDWSSPALSPLHTPLTLEHAPELRRHGIFGPSPDSQDGSRALVLTVCDDRLTRRHMELLSQGLRSDWNTYQPHITLAKIPPGLVPAAIRSLTASLPVFQGPIRLGPEIRRLP